MLVFLSRVKWFCAILAVLMFWVYGGGYALAEGLDKLDLPGTCSNCGANTQNEPGFDALLAEFKETLQQEEAIDAGRLVDFKTRLANEDTKVRAYFSELEDMITRKGLPEEIKNRHQEFVQEYVAKYETLMAHLTKIESAEEGSLSFWDKLGARVKGEQKFSRSEAIAKTVKFLQENTPQARKSHFDPNNLPHRSLKPPKNPIPPKLTPEEWREAFAQEENSDAGPLASTLSAVGDLLVGTAEAQTSPPVPEDLAETIEIQFTPEITQLATDLDNNPVNIFNWVRNNIEFVPTWGSIQGAQLCLGTQTCNAFDTSSLLIALLRVSGIPARYQMGTIDVPVEKAMNWLGGFTDPAAAARFVASGGTPSAGTVEKGGTIRDIRMEHVWVKAFLDYVPSQGEVNIEGDTWLDLDPSFKRYDRTEGEDFTAALGFDVAAFNDYLDTTTIVNEAEVSITSIDNTFIEDTIHDIVSNLSTAYPVADFTPLLPTSTIITRELSIIEAQVPYSILSRSLAISTLPAVLRHSMTISIKDQYGQPLLTYSGSLPELAMEQVSILFTFASQSDLDFIKSLPIPPSASDVPDIQGWQNAIPAHLVNVRPAIQLNGIEVGNGSPIGMGENLSIIVQFGAPTVMTEEFSLETVAWGRYAVTLDLAGISESMLNARLAKYQSLLQQYIDDGDIGSSIAPIMSSSHDLVPSTWFFAVDQRSELFSKMYKVAFTRFPSLAFAYPNATTISSIFGLPNRVIVDSYYLDVPRQFHVVTALNGDTDREFDFSVAIGVQSSLLEGKVLAEMTGLASPLPGMSAASALWIASQQGIPIHAIYSGNVTSVLPIIDDSFPKESISDAVNAGLVVFVPQQPPMIDGELISGYIRLDPQTGDGAYLAGRAYYGGTKKLVCKDTLTSEEKASCNYWLMYADAAEIVFTYIAISAMLVATAATLATALATLTSVFAIAGAGIAATGASLGLIALGAKFDKCTREGPPPGVNSCEEILWKWLLDILKVTGFFDIQEV